MNWNELRQLWLIPEPRSVRSITLGINNQTQAIETSLGSHVLRTYPADRALEHIRYELDVLRNLQQKTLPFHIPAPILTIRGESYAILSDVLVTLSPWLSGSPPQNDDLKQAYAAGHALAELGQALVDIPLETPSQAAPFPYSGDFESWAGIPIKPARLIQQLPLEREEQQRILTLLEVTQATTPSLYQALPQQIIHRDYDQSNVLMEDGSVTGVLDFEFCGPDLRVLDLAYALSQWPEGLWNTGEEWAVIDAFGRGYLQHQNLTLPELESLPDVLRLRATASLYFRFGRYVRGLETLENMVLQIRESLYKETWLQANAEELSHRARNWLTRPTAYATVATI